MWLKLKAVEDDRNCTIYKNEQQNKQRNNNNNNKS